MQQAAAKDAGQTAVQISRRQTQALSYNFPSPDPPHGPLSDPSTRQYRTLLTIPYTKHCNLSQVHVRLGFPPITLLRRYQITFLRRPSPADGSMPTAHLSPHSMQSRIHAPSSSLPSKCLNASSPPNHHLLFPCRPSRSLAMNSRKHLVVGFIFSLVRARGSGVVWRGGGLSLPCPSIRIRSS